MIGRIGSMAGTEPRFVLISTHQFGGRAEDDLLRLLHSLPASEAGPTVALHCLLQGIDEVPRSLARFQSDRVTFLVSRGRIPLARARNVLLQDLEVAATDYLMFPDDDCWFQPKFFSYLADLVRTNGADMILIRNDDPPATLDTVTAPRRTELFDVLRRTNSNNIIVGASLAASVGTFDERLGLGTPLGGGEDTDFALRAFRLCRSSVFVDAPLIGHRSLNGDSTTRLREMQRYWPGVMLHTLEILSPVVVPLACYRVAAGLFLLLSRRLTLTRFLLPFKMWLKLAPVGAPGR